MYVHVESYWIPKYQNDDKRKARNNKLGSGMLERRNE